MKKDEYVLIKAKVVDRQEGGKVLTVRLEDGFGNAENTVHVDSTITAK